MNWHSFFVASTLVGGIISMIYGIDFASNYKHITAVAIFTLSAILLGAWFGLINYS